MNRFKPFSLIERHTLGSALVAFNKSIVRGMYEVDAPGVKDYGDICIEDNDALLQELNDAIKDEEEDN